MRRMGEVLWRGSSLLACWSCSRRASAGRQQQEEEEEEEDEDEEKACSGSAGF